MGICEIVVEYVVTKALFIEGCCYPQLIFLELSKFNLRPGMDWLGQHNVYIDCNKRRLVIDQGGERPITFLAQKPQVKRVYIETLRGSDQVRGIDLCSWYNGQ